MSERRQQAWDEAHRRYATRDRQAGFVSGAAWADANPYSTPEDLVAAYEDGQRDAVSKGLAKARITGAAWADDNPQPRTITRHDLRAMVDAQVDAGGTGGWVSLEDMMFAALATIGIGVDDE